MLLKEVDKEVLSRLKNHIRNEAWNTWDRYADENDLDDRDIAEYFEEAMEHLWSDSWVEFLDRYNIQALYEVEFDGNDIVVDFWDV